MVVASTLAFLAINNKLEGLKKGQLVEMAMENEKRVGRLFPRFFISATPEKRFDYQKADFLPSHHVCTGVNSGGYEPSNVLAL